MKKKRIALLGGSFDPVHRGHVALANAALKQLQVDEVWFIPSAVSPLKERVLTSAGHRLRMLRQVCRKNPKFKICDVDLKRSGPSYSVDTLEILHELYPDNEWVWVLGADQAAQFDRWKNPKRLLELARFAVADRDENLKKTGVPAGFLAVRMDPVDLSSTDLRRGSKLNELDPGVLQYILDNELYVIWWIKPHMNNARFAHSNSVARLCRKLAQAHHYDPHKAYMIGLFHDIAKDMPKEELLKWMKACFPEALNEPHAIWHGYVGSEVAARIFGLYDPVIKNAIACHVKGTSYDPYAMMVFIADKLDPLRGYDSSGLIEACMHDLYNGFMMVKAENKAFVENQLRTKQGAVKHGRK